MSIESLKAQARRHEQKEEWQKALDQYALALKAFGADDQPDIGLFNRVGDLYVRVGNYARALDHYEQAVDLYREATLHNNAIAICKKIVRHVPARSQVYLTMGQIRAEQGFLPDARTNFLAYAERMQEEDNLEESFRALVEFCDLAPEDVDLRITVAEQMAANGRMEDALAQLGIAYRTFKETGREDRAFGLERRILELDPDADFDALAQAPADDGDVDYATAYGEIALEDDAEVADPPEDVEPSTGIAFDDEAAADEVSVAADPGFEDDEDDEPLPIMEGTSDWDDEYEEPAELPLIAFDGDADGDDLDLELDLELEDAVAREEAATPEGIAEPLEAFLDVDEALLEPE